MTKLEEIGALVAFRDGLPQDSYLRPWLNGVFAEVQDAILDDRLPVATYASVQARIDAMCNAAEEYKKAATDEGNRAREAGKKEG